VLGPEEAACRLEKSLYGLEQASWSWHTNLKSVFSQAGVLPSRANPGLFINHSGSEGTISVLVWVDDRLIVGPHGLSTPRVLLCTER
jgi:hypothetical protein